MNIVKFYEEEGYYTQRNANYQLLQILADFFTSEVGFHLCESYKEWILDVNESTRLRGNCTLLEKDNTNIHLSFLYDEREHPDFFKISAQALVDLIDEWDKKVIKPRPAFVALKEVDGRCFIETSNEAMP